MMPRNERLLELMAQRATEGLARSETREFDRLAANEPDTETDAFDFAAAALQLAYLDVEPMPRDVARRLEQPARPPRVIPWVGLIAAAATIMAAFLLWPDRTAFDESNAIHIAWKAVDDKFQGVSGEVVWDEATQRGYMVFRGLPVNDPSVEQYQLWIVDGREGHYKHPVDGGVFDSTSTGEFRVPIDAKLPVEQAGTFVLTAEQPGGVVVSDGPFLVLAQR